MNYIFAIPFLPHYVHNYYIVIYFPKSTSFIYYTSSKDDDELLEYSVDDSLF